RESSHAAEWDLALAALGGHPLQSALWGDARRDIDGVRDRRWLAIKDDKPVWMVRVEERSFPGFGRIGWAPKGPTGRLLDSGETVPSDFLTLLKLDGMSTLITNPWSTTKGVAQVGSGRYRTIWLDLSKGRQHAWERLDKQWRYGVRRAERLGV